MGLDNYLHLSPEEQRLYCEQAGAELGLPAASIEKDFWVCWILRELFRLPGIGEHLTFKGGTSLSKGWGLIHRFSEDIDIVIDRACLGLPSGPERESGQAWKRYLDTLRDRSRAYIGETLAPVLETNLVRRLPASIEWALDHANEDPSNEALLFSYASHFGGDGYMKPVVKIEPGARSDTAPTESRAITAFLAQYLDGEIFEVRCVHPRRTCWEKAMLLHEELSRPDVQITRPRLARHYYDLYRLVETGIAQEALGDRTLFEAVRAHRAIFFRRGGSAQSTMHPGSFKLIPPTAQQVAWQRDYDAMRESMFYGPPAPTFDQILATLVSFEEQINAMDEVGD